MASPFPLPVEYTMDHDFPDPRLSQILQLKSTESLLSNNSGGSSAPKITDKVFKQKVTEDYHEAVQEQYEMDQIGPDYEKIEGGKMDRGNHATMNRAASAGNQGRSDRNKRTISICVDSFKDGSETVVPTIPNAHVVGSTMKPYVIGPDNIEKQFTTLDRSTSLARAETEARYAAERGYRIHHTERERAETGRLFSYVNSPGEYVERLSNEHGGVTLPYSIARFSFQNRENWEILSTRPELNDRNSSTVTRAPSNARSDHLGAGSTSARASKSSQGANIHNNKRVSKSSQGANNNRNSARASGTHLNVASSSTARSSMTNQANHNPTSAPSIVTDPAVNNPGFGRSSATANGVGGSSTKPRQIFKSKHGLIDPDGTYVGYGGIVRKLESGRWTDKQVEAWEKFLWRRQDLMMPNPDLLASVSDDDNDDSYEDSGDSDDDSNTIKGVKAKGVKVKGAMADKTGMTKTKSQKTKGNGETKDEGKIDGDSLREIEAMLDAPDAPSAPGAPPSGLPSMEVLSPPGGIPFTAAEEADIKQFIVEYWDYCDQFAAKGRNKPIHPGPFHREQRELDEMNVYGGYRFRYHYMPEHARYARREALKVYDPAKPVPTLIDEERPVRDRRKFGWGWNHLDDMFAYTVVFLLIVFTIVCFFVDSEPVRRSDPRIKYHK